MNLIKFQIIQIGEKIHPISSPIPMSLDSDRFRWIQISYSLSNLDYNSDSDYENSKSGLTHHANKSRKKNIICNLMARTQCIKAIVRQSMTCMHNFNYLPALQKSKQLAWCQFLCDFHMDSDDRLGSIISRSNKSNYAYMSDERAIFYNKLITINTEIRSYWTGGSRNSIRAWIKPRCQLFLNFPTNHTYFKGEAYWLWVTFNWVPS